MDETIKIKLTLQKALLGNISKHVRVVCCDWDKRLWFKLRFYLDKEPDEEERELLSCILTEVESDIRFQKFYKELIFSNDSFEELDKLRLVVFWRNEKRVF